jgi:hypothetical protein
MKRQHVVFTSSCVLAMALAAPSAAVAQDYTDHTAVLAVAEAITDPASGEAGRVEYFRRDLGNAQLDHDFVYNDPRRTVFNGGAAGVTYGVNFGFGSADPNLSDQHGWLYDSLFVWDDQLCADLTLSENPVPAGLPGVVQHYFQTGQLLPIWVADLTQVGFLDGTQFPYFAANPNVLGVTFTLVWVDGDGNPTDIDGNGKLDVAFREIYYNDDHAWADNGREGRRPDGTRLFDFPTVAIHEVGHGFSAAHFGSIGRQEGALVPRPRVVMNAIYGGTLRDLTGRDVAALCSNWAAWPIR